MILISSPLELLSFVAIKRITSVKNTHKIRKSEKREKDQLKKGGSDIFTVFSLGKRKMDKSLVWREKSRDSPCEGNKSDKNRWKQRKHYCW